MLRTYVTLFCIALLLILAAVAPAVEPEAYQAVRTAQALRTLNQPVGPASGGAYFCEAEEFTQDGDVWLRVTNTGTAKTAVKSLSLHGWTFQQHSPYWVHQRNSQPVNIEVEPGEASAWTEVGSTMDALMAGQWTAPFTGTVIAALTGRQAIQLLCKAEGKRFRTTEL